MRTRETIKEIAHSLAYTPNHVNGNVQRETTIGCIMHSWYGSIASDILRSASEELSCHGYSLLLMNVQQSEAWIEEALRTLVKAGVKGILIAHAYPKPLSRHILYFLRSHGVYIVQMMNRIFHEHVDTVCRHEERNAEVTARSLVKYGHRSVFAIGIHQPQTWKEVFSNFGITLIFHSPSGEARAINNAFDEYLAMNKRPTVIITGTDEAAFRVFCLANCHDLRIPEQFSIIGTGNIFGDFLYPEIATLDIGAREMGRTAAELLEQRLHDGIPPGEIRDYADIIIEPTIIHRRSLGPVEPSASTVTVKQVRISKS